MPYVLNGKVNAEDLLQISWRDPFFETGLGVFETLRTIDGMPMFLERHLNRLLGGAKTLELATDLSLDVLRGYISDVMTQVPSEEARVKICLLLAESGVDVLVTAEPAPAFSPMTEARSAIIQASPFASGCDLPRTKLWNRMPYALARRTAEERGFDDALFLSPEGRLTETTRANLFFVQGGALKTPKLEEGILPGVTRAVVLELARGAGHEVVEGEFDVSELDSSDEAFLTGSFSGIQPVSRIEDVRFNPVPGPLTGGLVTLYERAARESIC